MIDVNAIKTGFRYISREMDLNKEKLIEMDQQNGDGDLGLSMSDGFHAVCDYLDQTEDVKLTVLFSHAGDAFNEAAPSSLGTILAFFMKGMARSLKGKESCDAKELGQAMRAGMENVMSKAGSKVGEKTILDAFDPAVRVLEEGTGDDIWQEAEEAAQRGSDATIEMRAVWGRAAYYGDASIGIRDGGSYAGALIFKALHQAEKEVSGQ